jgi:DNA (cytosine-5)-methyltransferase 1
VKTRLLSETDRVSRIDELLEATYESAGLGNLDGVLDETVFILISQQTRDVVYRAVFDRLRDRFPTWLAARAAPIEELEGALRPAGFGQRRARQLAALLAAVEVADQERACGPYGTDRGDLTLEFLHESDDAAAEAFLIGLPGIGPKSARCILAYALDRPAFAVDTHVLRIFNRLGIGGAPNRKHAHDPFQAAVPPAMRKRLHVNLVHHGRAVCRERRPKCGSCPLVSFCASGQRAVFEAAAPETPAVLELFAGAGGLAEGFRRAGFRIAGAIELDRDAAQTYRFNHPGTPVIEAEIGSKSDARSVRRALPYLGTPAAVIAGAPCQGYSAAGSREPDDPRNRLFEPIARIARGLHAPLVVLENVPGVRRVNGHAFLPRIELAFRRRGFRASPKLLAAPDFGVPQERSRYIFLIHDPKQIAEAPTFPEPTHRRTEVEPGRLPVAPTVTGVLAALPELAAGHVEESVVGPDGDRIFNISTMRHSDRVVKKIAAIAPGGGPISYRRLEPGLARTIIAGHRALPVHPTLNRTISAREAAAIQGFRYTYRFLGRRGSWPLQVANSVPPAIGEAVAVELRKLLTRQIRCRLGAVQTPE